MRRREARWNERYTPWGVALLLVYVAGLLAAMAWALQLEKPYPCSGRHNCSAEAMQ
jgi:hypothetical protein